MCFANYLDQSGRTRNHHASFRANPPRPRPAHQGFVGAENLDEIDRSHRPAQLLAGDVILLASDGLFNTLSMEEIGAAVGKGHDALADRILQQTLAAANRMQDNVTVLTLALTE